MCTGHGAHPLQVVSMGFLNFPLRRAQLQQSSSAAMQDFLDEAFEFPVVKAGGWGRF